MQGLIPRLRAIPSPRGEDRSKLRGKVAVPPNEITSKAPVKSHSNIFTQVHVLTPIRYTNPEPVPESHPSRSYLRNSLVKEALILFRVIRVCISKIRYETFNVPHDPEHTPLYPVANLTA